MNEEKRKALCLLLNIDENYLHRFDFKKIAENLLEKRVTLDPLNVWTKEDYKVILYFVIEVAKEKERDAFTDGYEDAEKNI